MFLKSTSRLWARRFFSSSEKPKAAADDILKSLVKPLILDVRDKKEVVAGKGGPPSFIFGSINVPLNIDGKKQSDHSTSLKEFSKKLKEAGLTLTNKESPIITHCGSGGRGLKA